MSQITTEDEVAQDIEDMKAEQYAELQEQFEDDEITNEELEKEMDRLFESGDEFLDVDPDARDMSETVDEAKFQARQIGEIVGLVVGVALFALASLFTAGRATLPMLLIFMVMYLAWSRFR
jgi:hypothetical protein